MGIKLRLLQSNDEEYFLDCIDELYSTIEKTPSIFETERMPVKHSRFKSFLVRKLASYPALFKLKLRMGNKKAVNFVSMISGDFRLLIPYAFTTKLNFIYMYDVWPRFHRWIFPLLDFFHVRYVFFSSRQVLENFNQKYSHVKCKAMWLPEALLVQDYGFNSFKDKTIDVLEFGRMYDAYHDLIVAPLAAQGKKHIYRKPDMNLLFPDKKSFSAALASAKVVICVPSNITHPHRAEYISSMTLRYLQAMASKCLIVGVLPSDMEELFGYNPIVEIDLENAGNQMLEVLAQYSDYESLIERNYQHVIRHHQWENRWKIIQQKIQEAL
ncbi:glycosyltransferase [Pedobacter petrophilus]|uniref:Glycosyltransferase n=1 Tax=Pedobacter petrophilus TaxID=1908241 RepID=A0A7K0FYP4_9SPHI|nr:glycosyltransferase [Pedobacter petrophilus]MRX76698.1 glycosyltransferase [Pedobacter petrophilus]